MNATFSTLSSSFSDWYSGEMIEFHVDRPVFNTQGQIEVCLRRIKLVGSLFLWIHASLPAHN